MRTLDYQQRVLDTLDAWLTELKARKAEADQVEALRAANPGLPIPALDFTATAWANLRTAGRLPASRAGIPFSPRKDGIGRAVPNATLKVPTGGGKTWLAVNAVSRIMGRYLGRNTGFVLWIVPNEAIYSQTLKHLKDRQHPYRQALDRAAAGRLKVMEKGDRLDARDVEANLCVMVLMLQAANRQTQETLRMFRDRGDVHGFFAPEGDQAAHARELAAVPNLDGYLGMFPMVKDSLGNALRKISPVVVMDEGQKATSELAHDTLYGFNPIFVLELTATPKDVRTRAGGTRHANLLVEVTGRELHAEDMIKMPLNLDPRQGADWRGTLTAALGRLNTLQAEALAYGADKGALGHIRPIMLVQVERTGKDQRDGLHIHAEDVKDWLLAAGLDAAEVAIKTAEQNDLTQPENLDLLSPTNRVRVIVTKAALQEGWDCPFAYVLCGLQDMKSSKDVEQILGRVLRMPYARPRNQPEMGKAYAHMVSSVTARVADQLADRLVNNMGFEAYEAALAIAPAQSALPLLDGSSHHQPRPAEAVISLPVTPTQPIPEVLRECIEIRPTTNGATAIVRGELTEAVEDFLLTACKGAKQQEAVKEAIERERTRQAALLAPSARGERFAPLPQLCLDWDGEVQPVEKRLLSELGEFDLFVEPMNLAGFTIRESGATFEIDVEGGKVVYQATDSGQLHLNEIAAHASENDLVRWLDRECRQIDVGQAVLIKWLLALARHLIADRSLTLTALVRAKYPLAEAVRREIERRRQAAVKAGFQKSLPGFLAAPRLKESFRYAFTFHPNHYPARPPFYSGRYRFRHHYYPVIHDMREKRADGQLTEEFLCARAIDMNPHIKHWVRNVEKEDRFSFWLPTSKDYFYPDFVCELTDGRVLVIEYKGAHLLNDPETREKDQVGHQWEQSSGGRSLFLMAVAEDEQGRDVSQQIANKLKG